MTHEAIVRRKGELNQQEATLLELERVLLGQYERMIQDLLAGKRVSRWRYAVDRPVSSFLDANAWLAGQLDEIAAKLADVVAMRRELDRRHPDVDAVSGPRLLALRANRPSVERHPDAPFVVTLPPVAGEPLLELAAGSDRGWLANPLAFGFLVMLGLGAIIAGSEPLTQAINREIAPLAASNGNIHLALEVAGMIAALVWLVSIFFAGAALYRRFGLQDRGSSWVRAAATCVAALLVFNVTAPNTKSWKDANPPAPGGGGGRPDAAAAAPTAAPPTARPAATSAYVGSLVFRPGKVYRAKGDFPIAASEDVLDQAIRYVRHGDPEAYFALENQGLINKLKPGTAVYVVEQRTWAGKVKIRVRGRTYEAWTLQEEIGE